MKLASPFPLSTISQNFGGNANPLYAGQGLKGHTGTDYGVPYGSLIRATTDGVVAWVLHQNDPTLMDYRAVGQMVDGGDGFLYEVSYGHLGEIYVTEGQMLKAGDPIGRVGNTGACYVGQHEVTEAEKDAGSHAGAHLHYQVRKCRTSKFTSGAGTENTQAIFNSKDLYVWNGEFVLAVDYNNGYNGCVDAVPFFDGTPAPAPAAPTFTRDLTLGMDGDDVRQLQQFLNQHGFPVASTGAGSPGQESTHFGSLTQKALARFQQVAGISPAQGYFGPKTRAVINSRS